jgi:hypothetical protein
MSVKRFITRSLILAVLALPIAAAGVFAAPTQHAIAKPGFAPGTWIGKGKISGKSVDGPMTSTFSGSIAFTLKVTRNLELTGSGSYALTMVGVDSDDPDDAVNSHMKSVASITFGGTPTAPTYAGALHVTGEVVGFGGKVSTPINFTKENFKGRLVITRAGHCKVVGGHTSQGVTVSWTALLKGSGTCLT